MTCLHKRGMQEHIYSPTPTTHGAQGGGGGQKPLTHGYWQWLSNGLARTLKKVTHIKERLLDQAVILFYCVLFHNGNFS